MNTKESKPKSIKKILITIGLTIIVGLLLDKFFDIFFEIGGSIAHWIFGIFVLVVIYYGIRYYYEKDRRKTIFIILLFILVFIPSTLFFSFCFVGNIFGGILLAMGVSFFIVGVAWYVFMAIYNGIRLLIRKTRRQKNEV